MKKIFFIAVTIFLCSFYLIAEDDLSDQKTKKQYTIYYSSEFGNPPENKKVDEGYVFTNEDLPELTEENKVFIGWTKRIGYIVHSDVKVTAAWKSANNGEEENWWDYNRKHYLYGLISNEEYSNPWIATGGYYDTIPKVVQGMGIEENSNNKSLYFDGLEEFSVSVAETTIDVKTKSVFSFYIRFIGDKVRLNFSDNDKNLLLTRDFGDYPFLRIQDSNEDKTYWRFIEVVLEPGSHHLRFSASREVYKEFNNVIIDKMQIKDFVPIKENEFTKDGIFNPAVVIHNSEIAIEEKISDYSDVYRGNKNFLPGDVPLLDYGKKKEYYFSSLIEFKSNCFFSFCTSSETESFFSVNTKGDCQYNDDIKYLVSIDGVDYKIESPCNYMYPDQWINVNFKIPAGDHTVQFCMANNTCRHFTFYFDDFCLSTKPGTLTMDIIGMQETYTNGDPLYFFGDYVLRDGTTDNLKIKWTCTGGTIDEWGVYTPGSVPGVYSVTATVGDDSITNDKVVIRSFDYLDHEFKIKGETFRGYEGTYKKYEIPSIDFWYYAPENPDDIEVDGFIQIYGKCSNRYDIQIIPMRRGYPTYLPEEEKGGFFNIKAFCFGEILERGAKITVYDRLLDKYEERVLFNPPKDTHVYPEETYPVQNGYQWAAEFYGDEHKELDYEVTFWESVKVGSYGCDWNNFGVSNILNNAIAKAGPEAEDVEILYYMYDWVVKHIEYKGTAQGEFTRDTIESHGGVCFQMANLYAALARRLGYFTTLVWGQKLGHNWVYVYYKERWYIVDPTWQDFLIHPASDTNHWIEEVDYFCEIQD